MVNTFLRKNLVKSLKFSSFQILLDTVLSYPRLLKMLKLNILLHKSFLGVFSINSQIILFIGKELMEVRYLVIFHLLILMYQMDLSRRYSIMLRKIMIKVGQIVHFCFLVMVMEVVVLNLSTLND